MRLAKSGKTQKIANTIHCYCFFGISNGFLVTATTFATAITATAAAIATAATASATA
jgi:hypothetical protein